MLTPFKKPESYTAVIFEHARVTVIELAHSPKWFILRAAGSYESQTGLAYHLADVSAHGTAKRERAFAAELGSFLKKIGASSRRLSFGLNTGMVMLQTVPMDASFDNRAEAGQALWELKHFDPEATDTSHVLITQRLAADPGAPVHAEMVPTVVVGVRRTLVQFLNNVASHLSSSFNILDVEQFCAENAFTANYPAARQKRTLVVGLDDHTFTASTLVGGSAVDVQVRAFNGGNTEAIAGCAREAFAEQIFLHGSAASQALCGEIRRALTVPVDLIDPLKVVALPGSVKGLSEIKARRHEFTAAVGLAMRTE